MGEEMGVDEVVGRWKLSRGRPLDRNSTLHPAGLIGGGAPDERFVEVHRLPTGFDPTDVVATLRQASRLSDPGLVTIVDVGAAELDGQPVIYLVTARWDEALSPGPRSEDDVLAMAADLAGGLCTLHRSYLQHGAIHRGGVRWNGSTWQLGPAGLAPLLETEIAPYRPAGLHVVEQPAPPADLWSLGVILHEQATGRLLRPGEQPNIPSMPRLTPLVTDLLQANPVDRPTADEVAERLATGLDATGVVGGPGPANWAPPTTSDPARGHAGAGLGAPGAPAPATGGRPLALYGAILAGVLAVVGLTAFVTLGGDDDPSTEAGADEISATDDTSTSDQDAPNGDGDTPSSSTTEAPETEETVSTLPEGPVSLGQVVVGDCLDLNLSVGDPTSARRVPCTDDHVAEVVGLVDHTAAGGAYPGRSALLDETRSPCEIAFADYVGGDALVTSLFVLPAVPTFGEWDRDERQNTVCLTHRFDGSPISESLAGRFAGYKLIEGSPMPISKLFGGRCFAIDGEIDTIGRRQVVTFVGCENLHRHEALDVRPLPLEPEEWNSETLTPEIVTKLAREAPEVCQEFWDGLSIVDGSTGVTINAIVPNVLDWQLGDRLMTCTVRWDEEVLGSTIIANLPPPGSQDADGDTDENDGG